LEQVIIIKFRDDKKICTQKLFQIKFVMILNGCLCAIGVIGTVLNYSFADGTSMSVMISNPDIYMLTTNNYRWILFEIKKKSN